MSEYDDSALVRLVSPQTAILDVNTRESLCIWNAWFVLRVDVCSRTSRIQNRHLSAQRAVREVEAYSTISVRLHIRDWLSKKVLQVLGSVAERGECSSTRAFRLCLKLIRHSSSVTDYHGHIVAPRVRINLVKFP